MNTQEFIEANHEALPLEYTPEVVDINKVNVPVQALLIKPSRPREVVEKVTKGGIILANNDARIDTPEKRKLRELLLLEATVIKVGRSITDIKIGDTIFYFKDILGRKRLRQGEEEYQLIQEYDVHGWISKDN